jgi:UDP-N-acetylmuramate--alanine ligase
LEEKLIDLTNVNHVHCIGIGGIGLSALAQILLNDGYIVSGSDMKEGEQVTRLIEAGATVYLGHRDKNIKDADLIVYSAAVHESNPEMVAASEAGIPCVSRAELLGYLMAANKNSIAVTGAHGKTTTTSMISLMLMRAGLDPTVLVGGNLSEIDGNVRLGSSDYFVTEACEYRDSFLQLSPSYAVILNIDWDHADYFPTIEDVVSSFSTFVRRVPEYGAIIAFDSNPFIKTILKDLDRRVITFGYSESSDYHATDIEWNKQGFPSLTVMHAGEELCHLKLAVPGDHNILNALAAFACCHDMGVSTEVIVETLERFSGTQRRFDPRGETSGGVRIVDDYAHHPEEIAATIKAARKVPHRHLWVIFQPHTYTRTLALHDEFAEALSQADTIVLAEIYAAREANVHQLSSKTIAAAIEDKYPGKKAFFFKTFEDIATFVSNNADDGDLVITMGAGDIYEVGEMILGMNADTFTERRNIQRT